MQLFIKNFNVLKSKETGIMNHNMPITQIKHFSTMENHKLVHLSQSLNYFKVGPTNYTLYHHCKNINIIIKV